jgi:hypothetical protein
MPFKEFKFEIGFHSLDMHPIFRLLFGEKTPSPFLGHFTEPDEININTASPFWKMYERDGYDIQSVLIEVICHEELELLIHDAEFSPYGVHDLIYKALSHVGIQYITTKPDKVASKKLQKRIFEEFASILYEHAAVCRRY